MPKAPKIDQAKFDAFKQTLPENCRDEHYRHLTSEYDVALAQFIVRERGITARDIDVAAWAKSLGLHHPEIEGEHRKWPQSILCGVSDEEAAAPHIDIAIPVIFAMHSFGGRGKPKEQYPILIDGNKRLRKAFLNKAETIKAFLLTEDQAKLAKVT